MPSEISSQNTFTALEAHFKESSEKRLLLENEKRRLLEIEKKSAIKEKIQKFALPLLFLGACALQQQNLTDLTCTAYETFKGSSGIAPQAIMASAYLALKGITYLNETTDKEEAPVTDRAYSWIKDIPSNFAIGVSCLPTSYALKHSVIYLSRSIFKLLSMHEINKLYSQKILEASVFKLAVKGPFFEELFFRAVLQDSLISAMKLVNLTASRWDKDIIFSDEMINTSARVFSATMFGLAHANQSFPQALSAGISSYLYETWLYEKNGLFGAFGLHSANNFLVCCRIGKVWA